MAGRGNSRASLRLMMIVGTLAVLQLVTAVTYEVGGAGGWTLPTAANDYNVSTNQNTYYVGDELLFKYNKDAHNVVSMQKEAFETCNVNDANVKIFDATGNTKIVLKTPGMKYYACGKSGHCSRGQRFSIMVLDAQVGAPGSNPSPDATPGSSPSLAINFIVSAAIALGGTALLL